MQAARTIPFESRFDIPGAFRPQIGRADAGGIVVIEICQRGHAEGMADVSAKFQVRIQPIAGAERWG